MKILTFIIIALTAFLNCLQTHAMDADDMVMVKVSGRGSGAWSGCRVSSIGCALSGAPRANRCSQDATRWTADVLKRRPRGGGCNVVQHSRHDQSLSMIQQLGWEALVFRGYIENGTLVL